jgi:hypothetical protein
MIFDALTVKTQWVAMILVRVVTAVLRDRERLRMMKFSAMRKTRSFDLLHLKESDPW